MLGPDAEDVGNREDGKPDEIAHRRRDIAAGLLLGGETRSKAIRLENRAMPIAASASNQTNVQGSRLTTTAIAANSTDTIILKISVFFLRRLCDTSFCRTSRRQIGGHVDQPGQARTKAAPPGASLVRFGSDRLPHETRDLFGRYHMTAGLIRVL